jgi:hypothetical protein
VARFLFPILVLLACAPAATAQPAPEPVTTTPDDLRTPLAPAFALLGATPTSIDRPQNARALTMNLFSAFREGEGLPRNYALDVTPFWLRSHPTLTFDGYYHPTLLQTLTRTFSVSVATASLEGEDPSTAGVTSLGFGVRTLVVQGAAHPLLQSAREDLMTVSMKQAALDDEIVKLEFQHETAVTAGRTDEARRLKDAIDAAQRDTQARRNELTAEARAIALRIQELDKDRVGLVVSVAAAHVTDFPGERFQDAESGRWGVWVTPAYRMLACAGDAGAACQSTLDVMAVARILADRRGTTDESTWDLGGRILWQPTREFALSAELVRRGALDANEGEGTARSVGVLEYRLRDDLVLFGSFGKDFDGEPGGRTLVSLLGLNLGFGRKPTVDMTSPK